MEKIKVFYRDEMVADSGGYSPSAAKPWQVYNDWVERGLDIERASFSPLTVSEIAAAHDIEFVRGVLGGTVENGHGNTSKEVAATLAWTSGSVYAAALEALANGKVACSPTSGFHHAGYDFAGGFCTFNGLMVAAKRMIDDGRVRRVGIVDYDEHYGNGTDDIIFRLSLNHSVPHVNAKAYFASKEFLDALPNDLDSLGDVDLILYQAGADMHIDDPLGGLCTTAELLERDEKVFEWCDRNRVPVMFCMAGGYQREQDGSIPKVLEIHGNTMKACVERFCAPLVV